MVNMRGINRFALFKGGMHCAVLEVGCLFTPLSL